MDLNKLWDTLFDAYYLHNLAGKDDLSKEYVEYILGEGAFNYHEYISFCNNQVELF